MNLSNIQFRDLKQQFAALRDPILREIESVAESCQFILGDKVKELEKRLAEYVGVKHCVSCANGTDALQLVLMAWGIGPGDAVFTSDFTYIASAGCASVIGATPVFVDINSDTFNMDPISLEHQIVRVIEEGKLKPKAIIPVDLFGQVADLPAIELLAQKYGLRVLEDAAQGFGGSINGKRAGAFGDAATTSFFPAKPLGCYGDGGAIFTNSDELNEKLQSLRSQGCSKLDKYDNRIVGINSRLDTLQAAILDVKLTAFEDYELDAVNRVASSYSEKLKDIVKIPFVPDGYYSSWAQFSIILDSLEVRDDLKSFLQSQNIPSMIYYPKALHQQSVYVELGYNDHDFFHSVSAAERILALPMHPYLREEDINVIASSVRKKLT